MIPLSGMWYFPTLLILIALLPLLYAEKLVSEDDGKAKFLRTILLGVLFYYVQDLIFTNSLNIMFKSWIYLFFLCNSLLFSIFFAFFGLIRRKFGDLLGYVAFVAFLGTFEYLLLCVDFSFPAILFGFSLIGVNDSGLPFIQWYEYTGVIGGSVWVLICNVFAYIFVKNIYEKKKFNIPVLSALLAIVLLPISLSLLIYGTYKERNNPVNFVLVQPNIDPYNEKFTIGQAEQRDILCSLARDNADSETDFIVFPETALDSNFWYNNINENGMIAYLRDSLMNDYPNANLITGAMMLQYFQAEKPPSRDAMDAGGNLYIQMYNAAFQIANGKAVQVYKKDKLVPGVERNPFNKEWDSSLGNAQTSNLAKAEKQTIFKSDKANIGTFICYESMFGSYCSKFADIGADILVLLTNDGWWLNSDIPLKHLRIAQLRAIESRRSIARCGNTGITAGIDQCGRIVAQSPWWEPTVLKLTLNRNKTKTVYSRYGNYLGVFSAFVSFFIVGIVIVKLILRK